MGKRPSSSSTTPTKKRKTNISEQSSLDGFFASPSQKASSSSSSTVPPPLPSTSRVTQAQVAPEIIDVDALDDTSYSAQVSGDLPRPSSSKPMSDGATSRVALPKTPAKHNVWNLSSTEANFEYPSMSGDPPTFDIGDVGLQTGQSIPYSFLTHTLLSLSNTRSRIAITNTLVSTFHVILRLHPGSLLHAIYLLTNSLGPSYEGEFYLLMCRDC